MSFAPYVEIYNKFYELFVSILQLIGVSFWKKKIVSFLHNVLEYPNEASVMVPTVFKTGISTLLT